MMTVETNITKRWEEGTPHHPESEKIIRAMAELDFKYGNDHLCLKYGGDGDVGEHMMYLLDIHFEQLDEVKPVAFTCKHELKALKEGANVEVSAQSNLSRTIPLYMATLHG